MVTPRLDRLGVVLAVAGLSVGVAAIVVSVVAVATRAPATPCPRQLEPHGFPLPCDAALSPCNPN